MRNDQLVGVRPDESCGVVVHRGRRVHEIPLLARTARIGGDVEDDRAIDGLECRHLLIPVRGRTRLIGSPGGVDRREGVSGERWRGVCVDVGNHTDLTLSVMGL